MSKRMLFVEQVNDTVAAIYGKPLCATEQKKGNLGLPAMSLWLNVVCPHTMIAPFRYFRYQVYEHGPSMVMSFGVLDVFTGTQDMYVATRAGFFHFFSLSEILRTLRARWEPISRNVLPTTATTLSNLENCFYGIIIFVFGSQRNSPGRHSWKTNGDGHCLCRIVYEMIHNEMYVAWECH